MVVFDITLFLILIFNIIQLILIPYYLLKIYNNEILNIIVILIYSILIFMLLFEIYYKKYFTKKHLRKYNYLSKINNYTQHTLNISLYLTFIYFGLLLNIYIKYDFDSNKFSYNEYYLTRLIFLSLIILMMLFGLGLLYSILAPRG